MTALTMGPRAGANRRATTSRTKNTQLLGDVLRAVMDERVCAGYEQSQRLRQSWLEVVPGELAAHCRIEEFTGGVIKVVVDGPAYMHELRLWKRKLCERLNSITPRCGVKDIKIVIG